MHLGTVFERSTETTIGGEKDGLTCKLALLDRNLALNSDAVQITNEPAHDKTYNKSCATSDDSDQPAHTRSLIRVFADRMCLLQPPGCPKRYKLGPYCMDVHVDPSLC